MTLLETELGLAEMTKGKNTPYLDERMSPKHVVTYVRHCKTDSIDQEEGECTDN
jgi:hypothetical protein